MADDKDNIFRMLPGGKADNDAVAESDNIPQHSYVIVNHDGEEFSADGFLLFTSQHVAIMRDNGTGALPVLVVPLSEVKFAEIVEDEQGELDL